MEHVNHTAWMNDKALVGGLLQEKEYEKARSFLNDILLANKNNSHFYDRTSDMIFILDNVLDNQ